ncbi:efflux RND transporter periplasmic adaptor subunit [Aurantivibrio plasticivorans]
MRNVFNSLWGNPNTRYSMIIALLMGLWLLSGVFTGSQDEASEQAANSEKSQERSSVRGRHIEAVTYPLRVGVQGKTEANRRVDLKAEVAGQVEALLFAKGQLVKKDEVICRLAVEDRELRLQEAQAAVEQARIEYEGSLRLKTGGYQSETAIASAKSRLEAAEAQELRRKIDLEKTSIRAPFDGVIEYRPVEIGTLMRVGDTCATVLDMNPLVVSGEVSEDEVIHLQPNARAFARLKTGVELSGNIRYIARQSEDITRTFRVEVAIDNPEMLFFSGITAEIAIAVRDVKAHLITASLLMLDDQGKIGVRTVDENDTVQFYNVDIIGDSAEGLWVTGLPEKTLLITVGQEYVANGDVVTVSLDTPEPASRTAASEDVPTSDEGASPTNHEVDNNGMTVSKDEPNAEETVGEESEAVSTTAR